MAKLLETLIDKSMEHDDSKIQEAFEGEKADNYSKAIKEGIYKQVYEKKLHSKHWRNQKKY